MWSLFGILAGLHFIPIARIGVFEVGARVDLILAIAGALATAIYFFENDSTVVSARIARRRRCQASSAARFSKS